jgi:uncharacterized protein with von Willebrand factor type A (vWA) domain
VRTQGGGIDARLLQLGEELRAEGVSVGTAELLDAFAALAQVTWTDRNAFHGALAATLAKSQEERRVFDLVFDRFFFRAAEAAALREGVGEPEAVGAPPGYKIDLEELKQQLAAGFARGSTRRACVTLPALRSRHSARARAIPPALSGSTYSASAGRWGCAAPARSARTAPRAACGAKRSRASRRSCGRELERAQIERNEALGPKRPLTELDRALPSGPSADLVAVHRVVAQLRRRLASAGSELRGHHRHDHVDFRRTMRASLQTGGVPVVISTAAAASPPRRSTSSATSRRASAPRRCSSSRCCTPCTTRFAGCARSSSSSAISEVTDIFARERNFKEVSER